MVGRQAVELVNESVVNKLEAILTERTGQKLTTVFKTESKQGVMTINIADKPFDGYVPTVLKVTRPYSSVDKYAATLYSGKIFQVYDLTKINKQERRALENSVKEAFLSNDLSVQLEEGFFPIGVYKKLDNVDGIESARRNIAHELMQRLSEKLHVPLVALVGNGCWIHKGLSVVIGIEDTSSNSASTFLEISPQEASKDSAFYNVGIFAREIPGVGIFGEIAHGIRISTKAAKRFLGIEELIKEIFEKEGVPAKFVLNPAPQLESLRVG